MSHDQENLDIYTFAGAAPLDYIKRTEDDIKAFWETQALGLTEKDVRALTVVGLLQCITQTGDHIYPHES